MTTASNLADELERAEDFLNDPNKFAISRRLRDRILSALRRVEPGSDQPRPSVSEDQGGLLGALAKHPNLSLQSVPSDFEGEPSEWAVFREHGSRSDREFTEIARDDTPLAALTAALAASDTPRFRCKRCGRDEIDCRANGCERGPCPMEFVG